MPEVYRCAILILSVLLVYSSNKRFLYITMAAYQKLDQSLIVLRYRCLDMVYGRVILTRLLDRDDPVDTKSLVDRRTWIMQEQMLLLRLVHFRSDQIQ
jgi:hypothetical protein